MKRLLGILVLGVTLTLMFGGAVTAGDRLHDRDQLKDGSCQTVADRVNAPLNHDQTPDCLRLRDGSCLL